jgi:hypothetical protein
VSLTGAATVAVATMSMAAVTATMTAIPFTAVPTVPASADIVPMAVTTKVNNSVFSSTHGNTPIK